MTHTYWHTATSLTAYGAFRPKTSPLQIPKQPRDWMTPCPQTLRANRIQREIVTAHRQPSDWLRREEAAPSDLSAVSESWQDQSDAEAKPSESLRSGFAAELN